MKFFHLSDLHIGLKLYNRDLYEDQQYIFKQICDAARQEQPDAVLIAGDIYDKAVPSAEAVDVFDSLIDGLTEAVPHAEIMMIIGNHDSASRINVFRQVLKHQKIHMIGIPPQRPDEYIDKVTLQDEYGDVNFYLLPFVKPSMVKMIVGEDENGNNRSYDDTLHRMIERESIDNRQRNVLVSHQFYLPEGKNPEMIQRMDSEVCTVGNVDAVRADLLGMFDYAALGHIHKPMQVGNPVYRYCGTPLACSVSEAGQQKGIVMVTMGPKGSVSTSVIPFKPLHKVMKIQGTLEEVLKHSCSDYVSVILTDREDLDVIRMKDDLSLAFPNLLEIRRDVPFKANYQMPDLSNQEMDPFALCTAFLGDMSDEERSLLQDVVNTVQGVQE